MAKPQSKERRGTVVLLIITWVLIMTTIFTTKCGSGSSSKSDSPNDSVELYQGKPLTDTILPKSKIDSTKQKSRKQKRKQKQKSVPVEKTRDMLSDTVRTN
ncbi:MAG: hypothetical protein K2O00_08045 [Muribaculaceae bacterium]|nr:hypothetical protein [Muribaculaceae bacterium]